MFNKIKKLLFKRKLFVILFAFVLFFVLFRVSALDDPILLRNSPGVTIVNDGDINDSKYSFSLKSTNATTVEIWGYNGTILDNTNSNITEAKEKMILPHNDSLSGNMGAWIRNVGTYKGKQIDLKTTFYWTSRTIMGVKVDPLIAIIPTGTRSWSPVSSNVLGFGFDPLSYEVKYELYSNNKPISVDMSMTIQDIDYFQYFGIKVNNGNISGIQALNNATSYYKNVNDYHWFFADETSSDNTPESSARICFDDINSFNIVYGSEYDRGSYSSSGVPFYWSDNYEYGDMKFVNKYKDAYYYFEDPNNVSYTPSWGFINSRAYGPYDLQAPDKLIVDSNENGVTSSTMKIDEEITYDIYQHIPQEQVAYYYNTFGIEDRFPSLLNFISYKVYDDGGNDVTSRFSHTIENNVLNVSAIDLTSDNFYNQTYKFELKFSINSQHLEEFKDASGNYVFNNFATAKMTRGGDEFEEDSNTTTTTIVKRKISGFVFIDKDYNDIYNTGDEVVSNHEVKLLDDNGDVIMTTTTNNEGKYSFLDIDKGSYYVSFKTPSGEYTLVTKNKGEPEVSSVANADYKSDNITDEDNSNTDILIKNDNINLGIKKRDVKLTVHHYKEGTTEKIVNDQVTFKHHGDEYTTSKINEMPDGYEGYVVVSETPNKYQGTITEDTEVTYYYKLKTLTLTVHHYKEGTTEKIVEDVVTNKTYGDEYTTSKINEMPDGYEGYAVVSETPNKYQGTITEDTEVTYYYKLRPLRLTVHHYKEGTTEKIVEDVVTDKTYGDEYTTSKISEMPDGYEGYIVVSDTPSNYSGIMKNDVEVTYYYKLKPLKLTVHHYKEGTTEKIVDDEIYVNQYKYGDHYDTSPSNAPIFNNYVVVDSEPDKYSGTITEDTEVIYEYKKKTATLNVKFVDDDNREKELSRSLSSTVYYGDNYTTTSASDIPSNYVFYNKTDNYSGVVDRNVIDVVYYYKVKNSQITSSIVKSGTELIDSVEDKVSYTINYSAKITDYIGDGTVTIVDKLPYKIDASRSNIAGGVYNTENDTITWTENVSINSYDNDTVTIRKVVEVYYNDIDVSKKVMTNEVSGKIVITNNSDDTENRFNTQIKIPSKIIIKYIDKETGKEILKQDEVDGFVGDEYNTVSKDIVGYKLVEEPSNKKYEFKKDVQTIIYKYEKNKVKVETKVNGGGGSIVGDEVVNYGNDSTPKKIVITADRGYVVEKVTINGKRVDIANNQTRIVLDNFVGMNENKLVEVSFVKANNEEIVNPKTGSSIDLIFMLFFLVIIVFVSNQKFNFSKGK